MKKTIFDKASYLDLQHKKHQPNYYTKKLMYPNQEKPVDPIQDINMETEAALTATPPPNTPEQAPDVSVPPIEVKLQAPKGYILFPEPPEGSDYIIGTDDNGESDELD